MILCNWCQIYQAITIKLSGNLADKDTVFYNNIRRVYRIPFTHLFFYSLKSTDGHHRNTNVKQQMQAPQFLQYLNVYKKIFKYRNQTFRTQSVWQTSRKTTRACNVQRTCMPQ